MSPSQKSGLVLAVYPVSRGFGWVLFEGPLAPVNWGIASVKRNKSAWCMTRFGKLIDLYRPKAILLEVNNSPEAGPRNRVAALAQDMRGFAANRDIDVHVYSRAEVATALLSNEHVSRGDVVEVVAELLPILRDRLPSPRRPWQSEDGRRCLFDAAALGIAHYRITRRES
jgi:hypothetical protein